MKTSNTDIQKGGRFEPPKLSDSMYQAFPAEPVLYGIDPEDGLPRPAVSTSAKMAESPPYSPDKLLCAADTSRFVRRDQWGEIKSTWPPSVVERTADGSYRVERVVPERGVQTRVGIAVLVAGAVLAIVAGAAHRYALSLVCLAPVMGGLLAIAMRRSTRASEWLEVEPVRPQCRHYVRKLQEHSADHERLQIWRMCTAQKDSEGEFISVGDQWMLGCDQRDPFDADGHVRLRMFDEVAEQAAVEAQEDAATVDFAAELAKQRDLLHDNTGV